jgi:3-oxoacyl-(acyl-carrier-protein) synthase
VITGLGVVSPLGNSFADVAESLLAGRSGVREIAAAAGAREGRQFAAPVTSIPHPTAPGCDDFASLGRLEQLCLALEQSASVLAPRLLALELSGVVRAEPGLCWSPL